MIIHFGLHLDGMQPGPAATAVGVVTLGPSRLLDLLELRLGLAPVLARPGEALLAYRACLAEADSDRRFYHRSFATDAIGVARTLLDWRAAWHEAGWSGRFPDSASRRLADMAAVEALAAERVPLDSGQRLARIAGALETGGETGIERLVLHDEPAALPAAWRRVLDMIGVVEPADGVGGHTRATRPRSDRQPARKPADAPPAGTTLDLFAAPGDNSVDPPDVQPGSPGLTDLERVQAALRALADADEGTVRSRETLAGDDSVVIVRGISRDLTAQAVGEYLLKRSAEDASVFDRTVVIAERDGIIVDNALERVGLPRAGFQHYSRFRAVAQVLKLALGLVWEPVSPHLLLQFLIHPVGPLSDYVRSQLAAAVAAEPGVGGTQWRETLDEIAEQMRTKFERSEKDVVRLIDDVRYWLECERFDPVDGAPPTVLIDRAQRCATWLAKKLHATDDEHTTALFAAAEAQSEALIAALGVLRDQGETRLGRIALERLVDEVGGRAADPATFAEAGHVRATTDPATLTGSWQTVIWWDLGAEPMTRRDPWSDAELEDLAAAGVALPSAAERIGRRMREWLRPILNARAQLVLVIHDRDEGRHPLWSRLESLFEHFNAVSIEEALLESAATPAAGSAPDRPARADRIPALDIPTEPLALAPLPRPRRWWTLPAGVTIPPRAMESYSSLSKLIDYPHEWVLNYAARLRAGRAEDLPSGGLLYGRLAHRLFERFFKEHENWATLDARAIDAWLADYLPRLVAHEGALLQEAGSGVRREQVLSILERAFVSLIAHLKSADITSVVAEQWLEAPFADVTLKGAIDLQLRDGRGREIVLDVKWSGEPYRGQELELGRCLQLATYAYMRRKAGELAEWPYHAYFIVATGNVLAPDSRVFPDALVFPPATGENIAEIWARTARTYAWRREQIAAGRIEVTAEGTERTADSEPPVDGVATADDEDRFDDYTWLTGWDQGA